LQLLHTRLIEGKCVTFNCLGRFEINVKFWAAYNY